MALTREQLEARVDAIYEKYDVKETPLAAADTRPKTFVPPTDAEIEAQAAADLLAAGESVRRAAIDTEADAALARIAADRARLNAEHADKTAEAKALWAQRRRESADAALKRGLARSTAEQQAQTALTLAEAARLDALDSALASALAALADEENAAEARRAAAVAQFESEHATRLSGRIAELKAERAAHAEAVVAYNNELALDTAKDRREAAKWQEENYAAARAYAASMEERELYVVAVEYLNGLPPTDAVRALDTDPIFRNILSSYDRSVLRNIYVSR